MQRIALVTGANRGIGLEVARQLAQQNHSVLMGGRDVGATQLAASSLVEQGLPVEAVELDVTDHDHMRKLAQNIEERYGKLDVLINNAAVYLDEGKSVFKLSIDAFQRTLDTNLIGPLALTQHLLPLLKRSEAARIVNVSSGMGALHDMGGREAAYRISKTGLNALTIIMANELRREGIKVNAVCPGWVRTEMGGRSASRSVEEGARGVVWAATLPEGGPSGGFFRDGESLDW
jgi:NAD(P)-dependent dehydrogenase (short-subunit alcohol dehydrogenase family)